MNISSPTIELLLNQNGASRYGVPGNINSSKKRLETSKFLAKNYSDFDKLRVHLFNHNSRNSSSFNFEQTKEVAAYLSRLGWIRTRGQNRTDYEVAENLDVEIRNYLRGHWLEEYVYEAFMEAGADEACHGQRIIWGSEESPSFFEIDVIARKDSQLTFVSCKAIKPEPEQGKSTELRHFMSEALSWDQLLSAGKAKVMVVTTADMIDERQAMKNRYQQLHEQAESLNQSFVGVEQLDWSRIVACCSANLKNNIII